MAKRKQLNIGLTPVQYAAVSAEAEAEGETVTAYCRDTILARAMPEPDALLLFPPIRREVQNSGEFKDVESRVLSHY